MRGNNRLILILLPVAAAVLAFWLLVYSPKSKEASELGTKVSDLRSQVDEQEQAATAAEAARRDFPEAYRRLVVLGKAAPEDDDSASFLVQLSRLADDAGVSFNSLQAEEGEGGEAPAPAPAPQTPADAAEESEQEVASVEAGSTAPAPPTEASAALLPIGASIGPAGLPVMKYALNFEGDFFRLADFLQGLDDLVRTRSNGTVGVRGRLVTVDDFELSPSDTGASQNPPLNAQFTITTFLTPADEGTTAGASPTGPAPADAPQPATGSTTTTEPTATASTATP